MVKPFQIGGFSDPGFTGAFLDGLVDEVELYDRALSAAEIKAIFDAGSAGKCKEPTPPPVVCSTEVRNTVNVVGKGRPFKKGALEGARVVMLSKDTVHGEMGIQNLLDARAVWAEWDLNGPFPAAQPETVFLKGSDGTVTVESFTGSLPADGGVGWAIYEDATGATVNEVTDPPLTGDRLPVTNGARQRAVANSDCADQKHMQWIATPDGAGGLNITSARQQKITGSLLTIIYPEETVWDQGTQLYPFIFTSDSDWTVDVCAEVPVGYGIVGAYDENGDLMTDSACAQTFVTGEVKVVAFEVVDIGSPEPVLGALLTVEHEGEVTEVDIEIPGVRSYVEPAAEEPAQLPTTGAGESGGGTPVWPVVAALAGVSVMLLGGAVIWRRRRA